jgi:hypothetical protein
MKILYAALVLFLIPVFSFSQSTNKAQLKSALTSEAVKDPEAAPGAALTSEAVKDPEPAPGAALLIEAMKDLEVAPEVIETYEKIAGAIQQELGETVKAENLKTIQVAVYGVTGQDAEGKPAKGGQVAKKILDIRSSNGRRDVIVDEDQIYIRTPEKITVKNIAGEVLSENPLNFNDWDRVGWAANAQLGMPLIWNRGYTISGEPRLVSDDGRYLVMFFDENDGWVIFMPDNKAKKLEL